MKERIEFIFYLRFHTPSYLTQYSKKIIQWSPFSDRNSSYCVIRAISLYLYSNKPELGHVAQKIKLTMKFDFMPL